MFKKISLPVQLVLVIIAALLLSPVVGLSFVKTAYTFSLFFRDILGFFLPFVVFSFILAAIISFEHHASKVLGLMLGLIFCSNLVGTLLAYLVGFLFLQRSTSSMHLIDPTTMTVVEPYFRINLPTIIPPEIALLSAIIIGLGYSFFSNKRLETAINRFKDYVELALNKFVIPFLPLYVFGFLLKVLHEGAFVPLFKHYSSAFILIVGSQTLYLLWMYLLANNFSIKKTIKTISTALPSYITAFSTISSAITIPVSIDCATKNTKNEQLSHLAMPIMANVHLLGAAFSAPLLALSTMLLFNGFIPDPYLYIKFAFYFCTTMFAVSGIPGAGIIVVMPLLVSILGFTPEMVSVITTVYLLLDPFGTAANVMGDGALVIILNNILKRLKIT